MPDTPAVERAQQRVKKDDFIFITVPLDSFDEEALEADPNMSRRLGVLRYQMERNRGAPGERELTFMFPLWEQNNITEPLEVTDKRTNTGRFTGMPLREMPMTQSISIRTSPDRSVAGILGDFEEQINILRSLKGMTVVTTTRARPFFQGLVREVVISDTGEYDDVVQIRLEIREMQPHEFGDPDFPERVRIEIPRDSIDSGADEEGELNDNEKCADTTSWSIPISWDNFKNRKLSKATAKLATNLWEGALDAGGHAIGGVANWFGGAVDKGKEAWAQVKCHLTYMPDEGTVVGNPSMSDVEGRHKIAVDMDKELGVADHPAMVRTSALHVVDLSNMPQGTSTPALRMRLPDNMRLSVAAWKYSNTEVAFDIVGRVSTGSGIEQRTTQTPRPRADGSTPEAITEVSTPTHEVVRRIYNPAPWQTFPVKNFFNDVRNPDALLMFVPNEERWGDEPPVDTHAGIKMRKYDMTIIQGKLDDTRLMP